MLRKIGKICSGVIFALSADLLFWHLFLTGLPDPLVQGMAAPSMTKEEALSLMDFHGVKTIYVKNREWVFDKNNQTVILKRKP